ncbi:hypothetical protein UCDDS831_g08000 [Diplodia seriata]|uniref:Uncharacterized protein n=1 Tax=Diplodia seriata TaxID=420778 RepID=A0A0G2DV53_9PEZI|nr:hypothetical protein UCDDS831_g08000 [Diplodia seriata]
MKPTQITSILAVLLATAAQAAPTPKLEGAALERTLAKLNAPEPWEKKKKRDALCSAASFAALDARAKDSLSKRQFVIDAYEELDTDAAAAAANEKRQFVIDAYEELDDGTEEKLKEKRQFVIDAYEELDDDTKEKLARRSFAAC